MVSYRRPGKPYEVALSGDEHRPEPFSDRLRVGQKSLNSRRTAACKFRLERKWRIPRSRETGRTHHRYGIRSAVPFAIAERVLWSRAGPADHSVRFECIARVRVHPDEQQSWEHLDHGGL